MRPRPLVLAVAAGLLLAACSSAGAKGPDWSPQPDFPGDGGGSAVPAEPGLPILPSSSAPGSVNPNSPSGSTSPAGDPDVVATHLQAPIGLVVLPDNTALVGERTTGRIVRVQPSPGHAVTTVRTIGGLDTSGDGGLLDLALSPAYAEDQLIFAYITTPKDNRVVDFTLTGPVTPVLTGIPRGSTGNTGRIAFGADGQLYVGTGDAGNPANVGDPHSLAGKILRISPIGHPSSGNPTAGSPIYASGPHEVDGLCSDASADLMLSTEARPSGASDVVSQVGVESLTSLVAPPPADRGLGGCAIESSVLYVTSRDGRALLGATLSTHGTSAAVGKWTAYLANRYGRLRTVVAAADGALWLTTSNRDGHGKPIPDDERVLRIQPPAQSGASPV